VCFFDYFDNAAALCALHVADGSVGAGDLHFATTFPANEYLVGKRGYFAA